MMKGSDNKSNVFCNVERQGTPSHRQQSCCKIDVLTPHTAVSTTDALTLLTPIGTLNVSLPSALEESGTDITPQRQDVGNKASFMTDSLSSKSHVVFDQRLALCRPSQPCPAKCWDTTHPFRATLT